MLVASLMPLAHANALPLPGVPGVAGDATIPVQAPGAEEKLRTAITLLQSGSSDLSMFEPMLRVAVDAQKDKVQAYFAASGH